MMIGLPNLAGDPGCDVHAINELRLAEIQAHEGELIGGGVPSRVCGRIGPIVFQRAWRHWIARGPVPIAVAEELYAAPAGRMSVRINEDGTAPPPEAGRLEWRMPDGALVVPTGEEAEFRRLVARFPHPQIEGIRGPLVFHDDPRALGTTRYIPLYHVDRRKGSACLHACSGSTASTRSHDRCGGIASLRVAPDWASLMLFAATEFVVTGHNANPPSMAITYSA